MTDISDVLAALQEAIRAMTKYAKAHDEYEGGSWDRTGHYVIEELKEAQALFSKALGEYIDDRVEAAIRREKAQARKGEAL